MHKIKNASIATLAAGVTFISAAAVMAQDAGIVAFRDVCVGSAPDFKTAAKRAEKYVGKLDNAGSLGALGMSKDGSIGVQITPGRECAITTENRVNPRQLTAEFQQAIFGSSLANPGKQNPMTAKIRDATFIFVHDTRGGEAYVMLRK